MALASSGQISLGGDPPSGEVPANTSIAYEPLIFNLLLFKSFLQLHFFFFENFGLIVSTDI